MMVIETDDPVPDSVTELLKKLPGILRLIR